MSPLVTVVIPTHNRPEMLAEAIASVSLFPSAPGLKLNQDVEQRQEALFHVVFGPDNSASDIEEFDQVRVAVTAFV